MGTPDFAVGPLKALFNGGYNVVAVVTMPDKPAGRGMKLQASPVKQFALDHSIPVLQPEKLKDESFIQVLSDFTPDLQIVVAFRMLPEVVWALPPMGTFNLHASLLPQYRGAAPIHWAVINGESETGVTTFFLNHTIDTGDLLLQERLSIDPNETTGSVHDRLMLLGSQVVCKTVDGLCANIVQPIPQTDAPMKVAPKLFKDNTRIRWDKPAKELHDFIRGLSPFPAAWTEMIGADGSSVGMKIFKANYEEVEHGLTAGSLVVDGKSSLKVAVRGGYIQLIRFQLAGRKALNADEFLRGFAAITHFRLI